jgi:hypothetical protein
MRANVLVAMAVGLAACGPLRSDREILDGTKLTLDPVASADGLSTGESTLTVKWKATETVGLDIAIQVDAYPGIQYNRTSWPVNGDYLNAVSFEITGGPSGHGEATFKVVRSACFTADYAPNLDRLDGPHTFQHYCVGN